VELLHVLGEVVLTLRVQHGRKTSVLEPFKVLFYGSESLIPSPNFTNLWYRLETSTPDPTHRSATVKYNFVTHYITIGLSLLLHRPPGANKNADKM
jgi:hypothetical protein